MDPRRVMLASLNNKTSLAVILFYIMHFTFIKGEPCVVDGSIGETSSPNGGILCGSDAQPCHQVQQCFTKREDAFKEILIKNDYTVTTTTKINTSVSITRLESPVIKGPPNSYFIEITGDSRVRVNITNIHFSGIGILKFGAPVDIFITNCTTIGVVGSVVLVNPETEGFLLRLFRCVFIDGGDYTVKKIHYNKTSSQKLSQNLFSRLEVDLCNFTRSKGLFVQANTQIKVVMKNTAISESATSFLVVEASGKENQSSVQVIGCTIQGVSTISCDSPKDVKMKINNVASVTVKESTFVKLSGKSLISIDNAFSVVIKYCSFKGNNASLNGTGGAIKLSNTLTSSISHSVFVNNMATKGGSIAVHSLKTLVLTKCTFRLNRADLFGADVYVEKANETVFNGNVFANSSSGAQGGSVYIEKVIDVRFQDGNTFKGCSTEKYGGCVYIKKTSNVHVIGNNSFQSCHSNINGGCIQSYVVNSLEIEGHNSFFDCSAGTQGGCLGVYTVNHLKITGNNYFAYCSEGGCAATYLNKRIEIEGSNTFRNCTSNLDGGCIFAYTVDHMRIKGRNAFLHCAAVRFGGCIFNYIGKYVEIEENNIFGDCSSKNGGCIAAYTLDRMTITKRNSFKNCISGDSGGCIYSNRVSKVYIIGNNTFNDCSSDGHGGSIFAAVTNQMVITGGSFSNSSSGSYGGCIYSESVSKVYIKGNSFSNSSSGTYGGCIFSGLSRGVQLIDSRFVGNTAMRAAAVLLLSVKKSEINNCWFSDNTARDSGGAVSHDRVKNITILNSYFFRNRAEDGLGGAVSISSQSNVLISLTTFKENQASEYGGGVSARTYGKSVENFTSIIVKCLFMNNFSNFGGGISTTYEGDATPYQFTIEDSSFYNCSANTLGQSIYNNVNLRVYNVSVKTHEKKNVYHIYSFINYVDIRNLKVAILRHKDYSRVSSQSSAIFLSSFGITIQQGMNLICPVGFNVITKNSSYTPTYIFGEEVPRPVFTFLQMKCDACNYNKYTLGRGQFRFDNLTHKTETFKESHDCLKCPEGGNCDKDVRALDNHWGYFTEDNMMKFVTCPQGFCCTKDTTKCTSFNTCNCPRTGILCGKCREGFKLSFITPDCIPKGEICNFLWFTLYVVMFSVGYTAIFVLITNLSDVLNGVREFISNRSSSRENDKKKGSCHTSGVTNLAAVVKRASTTKNTFSIAGSIQIIVLFFQVASMLQVRYQGKEQKQNDGSFNEIRESISNAFNFRFSIYQGVCPSDNLILPEKEAILFGIKMITFLLLIAAIVVYAFVKNAFNKTTKNMTSDLKSVTPNTISDALPQDHIDSVLLVAEESIIQQQQGQINFGHRLKMTYLKLLKLYFTPVTKSALTMTHCVAIKDSYHLFVYGELVCYTNWQIGIIATIIPGILIFPVSYELSTRLLKKRVVSSTNFIAATACPYYGLLLYMFKYRSSKQGLSSSSVTSPEEDEFARRVLQTEEELLAHQENTLNWQTIQFYRTVLMNIVTIYLTNPLYQYMTLVPALFLFYIHDRVRQPFKDVLLNRVQELSSGCLLLVLLCNLMASISFTADISMVDGVTLVVTMCNVIEMMFYAIVLVYLPIWKIWNMIVVRWEKKTA